MASGNALTPAPVTVIPVQTRSRVRQLLNVGRLVSNLSIIILVVVLLLLALFVPNFATSRNIVNIFVQASTLGLMAIGVSNVLITGGMDLSIPSNMALSAILGAMVMRDTGSLVGGALVMVLAGTLIGCFNGFAVAKLKMIPFVVTLATMTVLSGTAVWITNSTSVAITSEAFYTTLLDRTLGIPRPIIILAIVALIATVVIRKSLYGRWLYAIGVNVKAARVSGVPTDRVIFSAYVVSGFFAGLTAVLLSARLGSASANMGNDGVVLDVISSAVVGGVSIYGGVGGPLGAVLGAIFITAISNSMNAMQISYFTSLIIKGIVIITFVALDTLRRR